MLKKVVSELKVVKPSRWMSTIRYHEQGYALDVLKVEEDEKLPSLGPNQVSLKFLAAPINPADLNMVEGGYGIQPKLPQVGGNEGVAVVTGIGSNVSKLSKDDYVVPNVAGFGTWRNFALADASEVTKIPNNIPVETAATLSVNPCTAYRMLTDFVDLKEGDVIIQNGADSTVGQAVVQLAALRGIKTINVMRNTMQYDEMNERLKGLGGTIVCTSDYIKRPEFKRLIADLPKPKLALNCIGGKDATDIARVLDTNGTLVTYGGMSKEPVTLPTSLLIFKNIQVRGFWMTEWVKQHSVEEREAMINELAQLAKEDKLNMWMQRYNFSDFHQALKDMKLGLVTRKPVLMMDS